MTELHVFDGKEWQRYGTDDYWLAKHVAARVSSMGGMAYVRNDITCSGDGSMIGSRFPLRIGYQIEAPHEPERFIV